VARSGGRDRLLDAGGEGCHRPWLRRLRWEPDDRLAGEVAIAERWLDARQREGSSVETNLDVPVLLCGQHLAVAVTGTRCLEGQAGAFSCFQRHGRRRLVAALLQ